jgi:hypothetical protein
MAQISETLAAVASQVGMARRRAARDAAIDEVGDVVAAACILAGASPRKADVVLTSWAQSLSRPLRDYSLFGGIMLCESFDTSPCPPDGPGKDAWWHYPANDTQTVGQWCAERLFAELL